MTDHTGPKSPNHNLVPMPSCFATRLGSLPSTLRLRQPGILYHVEYTVYIGKRQLDMSCGTEEGQGGDDQAEALMPKRRQLRRGDKEKSQCQRCKKSRSLYIFRQAVYCAACFEISIYGRFVRQFNPPLRPGVARSAMTSYRPPKQTGDALIAVSGGAGSMAMLDILIGREYIGKGRGTQVDLTKGEKDPTWDKGTMVYVEFASVTDMPDRMQEMELLARRCSLDFVGLRAEDVFDPALRARLGRELGSTEATTLRVDLAGADLPIVDGPSTSTATPLDRLQTLLTSLPPASRPALLSHILDHLLTLTANCLPNVSHLLVGETSTRQAQRIISGTALGRGWSLPLDLSPAYDLPTQRERKVLRMKPMKELSVEEVSMWCRIHGITTVNHRGWGSVGPRDRGGRAKGGAGSIEGLTEQFIAGLSVTHPSTVSTINRTGDKLVFPGNAAAGTCPLCQFPVDRGAKDWKSRTALTSLRPVVSDTNNEQSPSREMLDSQLCYACLTTLTTSAATRGAAAGEQIAEMPFWVDEQLVRRRQLDHTDLQRQVGEFLLPQE